MLYDTSIEFDKKRAIERFKYLIDKKKRIELIEKKKKRSLSQNNYLHLILSWFGLEFGYTLEEVKQEIFKKEVNPEIFYDGEKSGLITISRWRSTADCNTEEISLATNRFRDYSAKNGCYLPEPNDLPAISEMERQLSQHNVKQYL
ncbi:hypothetical protein [Psychroflexus aestuariivivens]|uniref:hypothetical protein n=1 Tax=Psychroflexus aestuariivivens TaxID=1795040 RepID=UPI000FDCB497|nr:hypothetical protein [Psychroflexus aestuariivivens]